MRVLEGAVAEGRPYLVMEYAPGGSLRRQHADGVPLALPMIERYVQQSAQALQYAHYRQVIYRDVKPACTFRTLMRAVRTLLRRLLLIGFKELGLKIPSALSGK